MNIMVISVCMPFEGDYRRTDELADQLSIIEEIISSNPNYNCNCK